jgi:DNA-3-methyladenine glycosylase I
MAEATPADSGLMRGTDGRMRCAWAGLDPLYAAYHDTEWGVPEYDSRALFEKLILDGFQAGLSWITILRKRDAFRAAFDGFVPEIIVRYDEAKVEALMADAGIVRNRAKIRGTIASARAYLDIEAGLGFSKYLWSFFDGVPQRNRFETRGEVPTATPASIAMSKDLKARGFTFCGPTIIYAFCQATGMVDDHLCGCWRHGKAK